MSTLNEPINSFPKPFQGPWEGDDKIVIGIDIGTTQSGVAFAFLEKGIDQSIQRVTQWPGQEAHDLQSKMPSLIWYDSDKKAVSFGAEALTPEAEDSAEDNGWQLAKHFKLHLNPNDMKVKHDLKLDALPSGVSLRQVYSDFLGYLLQHTQKYFEDRIVDGRNLWQKHRATMQFIIAHPNGWGIREQTFLRTAAVKAGFATADTAPTNVRFVTEAEASVHFCIYHTNIGSRLQPGSKFAVCDAGGSTVDTTVYSVTTARPVLKLEEARASACVQAGAIFVNAAAERHIHNVLTNAGINADDVEDYTKRGIQDFENAAKRNFCDAAEDKTVEIAGSRVNNAAIRTRRGRMTLPGAVVKSFFDVCVDEIKASVEQQIKELSVSHILLVGGFGDSPYLRREFQNQYDSQGCQITLTNDSTSKAVAEGAVIWSAASSVMGRAPRSSFGIETTARYNPVIPDHRGREIISSADGHDKVGGRWSQIVAKGVVLDTEAVARESFSRPYSTPHPDLEDFDVTLVSYAKDGEPTWMLDKEGELIPGFQNSCVISANLKNLSGALQPRIGSHGAMYWRLHFDVCIRFGGTELEAYLEWEEQGATRTSAATIIPEQAHD